MQGNIATRQLSIDGCGGYVYISDYWEPNTDDQRLSIAGHLLTIENGNTITLPDNVNDADANPTNELQTLGFSGYSLSLSPSGGTIAFITGIYEELIDSIKSLNAKALQVLFKEGLTPFWKHINGSFCA